MIWRDWFEWLDVTYGGGLIHFPAIKTILNLGLVNHDASNGIGSITLVYPESSQIESQQIKASRIKSIT